MAANLRFHQLFELNHRMRKSFKHFNADFPRRSLMVRFNKGMQESRRHKLVGFLSYIVNNEEYYRSQVFC